MPHYSGFAPKPARIAKIIARSGLCSRREAEQRIAEGRVAVNGEILDTPARNVESGDRITVDGRPLPPPVPVKLWRYHKPKGQVTTHRDPEGRPTVFDSLGPELPRVISVGRLDITTEGLLLLTTNGGLARHLELPSTGWLRRYRVRANGKVNEKDFEKLQSGITIEAIRYGPIEARIDRVQGSNCWLTMGLREGKNREIKRVLEHLGLSVNRLIRVSYGPFLLGGLKAGQCEEIKPRIVVQQLGPKVAAELGLSRTASLAGTKGRRPRS
jgi:23S rRNA pseudouridine2605 synthase